MAVPTNILQQVETYQSSGLALLLNSYCFISTSNKKFNDFDTLTANLGTTVTFDLPPRFSTVSSLVAVFEPAEQREISLTVDQEVSTSYAFTVQQFKYNVQDYMGTFGKSATCEIGSEIESSIAENCLTHTYRFYGNGVAAIDSSGDLAAALALFRNYGAAKTMTKGYLSDIAVPAIVASNLTQFALNRNNKEAMSWDLGSFSNCDWYESNLLPEHIAGTVGQAATTLVITAVTTDADGGISAITCSGAGVDADAIKENDLLEFQDGVAGETDIRYRTFIGHKPSANHVQIRATADAASVADSVVIPIFPKLYSVAGNKQNVTTAVSVDMELKALPSHRAGMITAGDPLFTAIPSLPDEVPYPTASAPDPESGASIRQYYGSVFGKNERGMIHDAIWGSTAVDEYCMRLVFPL